MLRLRPATAADVPSLRRMIFEFATFERLAQHVTVTEEELARDGFGAHSRFRVLLPEWDGKPAGYELLYDFTAASRGADCFSKTSTCVRSFAGRHRQSPAG